MSAITASYPLWMYEIEIYYSYNMFVCIHEFLKAPNMLLFRSYPTYNMYEMGYIYIFLLVE